MLTRSISRTEAAPMPTDTAVSRIFAARRSRSPAVSFLESSTPRIARWSGGITSAQATTDFVDAGDEGTLQRAELALDRSPAIRHAPMVQTGTAKSKKKRSE